VIELVCCLCWSASGEPARCRHRSEKPAVSQREEAKVSHAAVVGDVSEQDTAVATGSTAWATTHKLHETTSSPANKTVLSLAAVFWFINMFMSR